MENVGYAVRETVSIIYGASVLLGGGLGLIVAFVIEVMRASRNKWYKFNVKSENSKQLAIDENCIDGGLFFEK